MFGFGKKEEKPKRSSGRNLSQFGLFDIPGDFKDDLSMGAGEDDDGNDDDLEAELAALTAGNAPKVPKRKPQAQLVSPSNLDKMIAESLKDIPSDEDVSEDENDPNLLSELNELTGEPPVGEAAPTPTPGPSEPANTKTLLAERLKMYELAEENAKKAGETSRARRFNRGIKTIKDLIKTSNAGRPINPADIPPEVAVTITKKPDPILEPIRPAPSVPGPVEPVSPGVPEPNLVKSPEQESMLEILNQRKRDFKLAAVNAKREENTTLAVQYVKIAKQFDAVIAAVESGQPVDLSKMPPSPFETPKSPQKEENPVQQSSEPPEETPEPAVAEPALLTANIVLEALQQRLEKYKSEEAKAKTAGNSSKARRMGRIVKQFEDAIKAHNAGKTIAFNELPTPPGFAPIPGTVAPELVPVATLMKDEPDEEVVKPATPEGPKRGNTQRISGNQSSTTQNEKQLNQLLQKQHEFKVAALNAKKNGEVMQAKEYLKMAKGLDKLIEASKCGLPVDMSTVPIPASARSELDDGFDIVMAAECDENTDKDTEILDIVCRMEEKLTKQLKLCFDTRDHLQAIGDVAGKNRFENLALNVTRDLDYIRVLRRQTPAAELTGNPPKFHYEMKKFSYVKCNTDLNDDELDLQIIRGINYKCANPNEIDTYVKFEFPYPQEEPVRDRTGLVKDTNNPEYNASFKIPIQRNVRACQRVFKRHGVKLEIYSKGGFFRSDQLLGTFTIKLQDLENKVEIHNSYDLMDGRKIVGGKLEVKIRLRNPLISRQIEELSEKWLVLDI